VYPLLTLRTGPVYGWYVKKNGDSISSDDDDDNAAIHPVLGDMDRQALAAMRPSRVGRRGSRADRVDLWHGSREGAPVYYRFCAGGFSLSLFSFFAFVWGDRQMPFGSRCWIIVGISR
jgi:hypothetical protein